MDQLGSCRNILKKRSYDYHGDLESSDTAYSVDDAKNVSTLAPITHYILFYLDSPLNLKEFL